MEGYRLPPRASSEVARKDRAPPHLVPRVSTLSYRSRREPARPHGRRLHMKVANQVRWGDAQGLGDLRPGGLAEAEVDCGVHRRARVRGLRSEIHVEFPTGGNETGKNHTRSKVAFRHKLLENR